MVPTCLLSLEPRIPRCTLRVCFTLLPFFAACVHRGVEKYAGHYKKAYSWEHNLKNTDPAHVTWEEATEYCNWLSNKEGLEPCYKLDFNKHGTWTMTCNWNANGYRLPTEAEFNYAAPGFLNRIESPPKPFPRRLDPQQIRFAYLGQHEWNIIGAMRSTMFWDIFDHRYFRESPKIDPTGPKIGCGHASRQYRTLNFPSNNGLKPFRSMTCRHTPCQFYTAKSWIVKDDVSLYNRMNRIPQWDR